MNILGLYGGFDWDANKSLDEHQDLTWTHDAGATLISHGNHVTSISEERLTRIKYDGNFPQNSVDYCLSAGNLSYEDIDLVCVPSMCLTIWYKQYYEGTIHDKLNSLFPNAKIKFVSHHLSHAASAVFSSNFNEGSFLVLDGAGSLLYAHNYQDVKHVETNSIGYFNKEKGIFRFFPGLPNVNEFGAYYHSLSHKIYCEKIQKQISGYDEKYRESWDGKIMGLSAYGSHLKFTEELKDYQLSKDLVYEDMPYITFDGRPYKENHTFKNADEKAYILQKNFECALLDYVTELKNKSYLDDYVCLAGGSFLNVLGNSVLKQSGLFKDIHVPPYPNDVGLHFGAACFGAFQNKEEINLPNNIALLGKEYPQDTIEKELQKFELNYKKYENFEELCEFTAQELNKNKIIGWFQNRSEFGPRALGSRSLLMHPGPAKNKDIMNSRVKHREYWRPFAGIVLEEHLNDYFEEDFCSPYMLYSLTVKEEKRDEIAAITHVDNTCRIQTVTQGLQPEVNTLIEKFKEVSGIPVVLNTSFNDNGEPIVETPEDAIRAFNNLDIDYLVIGNYIVKKSEISYS
jgi:carbamoyltransferase